MSISTSIAAGGFGARANLIRGGLSIADQLVCSASSFVTLVILSHALFPAEFGSYMLAFNAVLMLAGLQQGLVTGPYRVLGAPQGFAPRFIAAQARIQVVLLLVEAVLLATFLHGYLRFDFTLVIVSVAVLVLLQLHEFVRTVLTTRLALQQLLLIDGATHALRVGGLLVLQRLQLLSAETALGWLAVSCLVAWSQVERNWAAGTAAGVWTRNWRFGRWLIVESVAYMVSTRSYLYVIAALLGREQVAAFGASQNLANSVNVIVMGITAVAVPIAKLKLERQGYQAWRDWLVKVSWAMLFASGAAFAVVAVFARPLMVLLYPPFYAPYSTLVTVLAFGVLLEAGSANLTSAFWTAERPDLNVVGRLIAAAAAIAWVYPGVVVFGLYGAAAGLVMAPVIWLVVGGIFVLRGALAPAQLSRRRIDRVAE